MEYSNEWLRFRKAEDEYFTSLYYLMQNKEAMLNDLAKALAEGDRHTALRLLLKMKPEAVVLTPLLAKIVEAAVDSSNLTTIELAREVLNHYKDEPEIRNTIQAFATIYLAENDE